MESKEPQDEAINHLLNNNNVFITGSGGTGKSYLLKNLYTALKDKGINVHKTGSTGVAAENINGMTLHSWAGVQLGDKEASTYHITIRTRNRKAWKRWTETQILFIDEISMIGGKLFTMLNKLGQLIRGNSKPFGGITLLLCGDFCQLPPVRDEYLFKSPVFESLDLKYIKLRHPWRYQTDIEFFHLLSRARLGELTREDIAKLTERKTAYLKEVHGRVYKEDEIKPTILYSKKIDVWEMNMKELDLLPHDEYKYVATDHLQRKSKSSTANPETFQDLMDKNVPPELSLKKGAQVMLTWNLDVEQGLCNGSRGVVLECLDEYVMVKFKNCEMAITPNVWTIEDEDNIFTRAQVPLALAWSCTIHKSQSASLDSVVVDLGTSIFSNNMAYVALSRCRCLSGIYLINLIPRKIVCDPDAKEFELSI